MHPFRQVKIGDSIHRTFDGSTSTDDLIWHRDKCGRKVTVTESNGWQLQFDGQLPIPLVEGNTYSIPAKSWHRVIKGHGPLRITINEDNMAINLTESRLRRIIREEILREVNEKWVESESAKNYTAQEAYDEGLDEADSRKYGKKEYRSSSGSVAAIKKHGGSASKAVKAGAFDWADDPMAAAQAAHIVAMGEPTVAKGSKKKKK